jgi:hypothetical protein
MKFLFVALALSLSACAPATDTADTYGPCSASVRADFEVLKSRNPGGSPALISGIQRDVELDNNCYMKGMNQ